MMSDAEKTRLAAMVLQRGKVLVPDRFPQPSRETAEAWGRVLGSRNLPVEVWPDAVDLWAAENVGDRMVTPRDLLQAARSVLDRWKSDPVRREFLEARALALRDARDAALDRGELRQVRSFPPLEGGSRPSTVGAAALGWVGDRGRL